MRYVIVFVFIPFVFLGQTPPKKTTWFDNNVSIRKTFDGSKNENKPATFALFEDHKSSNDFISADIAVKISEWELLQDSPSSLSFFPVVEYHRSSNENDEKDKLSVGLNGEYYFGNNWSLKPYLLSNLAYTRNLLEGVNEIKYVSQFSFFGTKKGQPGHKFRFDNEVADYKGTYYPYFGFEYNEIPDFVLDGNTEKISAVFFRIFLEYWLAPKSIQFIGNGVYRNLISTSSMVKKDLPLLNLSLNYYPGGQDKISIGIDYKNGYEPSANYALVESTSLSLKFNY